MTRLLIIGSPVTPGPAEAVQRAALDAAGREVEIEHWERRAHQLSEALGTVVNPDVMGAMIGPPHKERAASLIGLLADEARASGAVSVVVNQDGRLYGANTDVAGVRAGLESILTATVPLAGPGGGAGRRGRGSGGRIGPAGSRAGADRGVQPAPASSRGGGRPFRSGGPADGPARPPMARGDHRGRAVQGAAGGQCIGGRRRARGEPHPRGPAGRELYVLDLVLNRAETPLMREAAARGGTVANGQGSFLVAQAAAFQLWTGDEAPMDVMRTALAGHLGLPEEGLAVVGD